MNTTVRRIIAGLGYIDGYGHHPGWPLFLVLVASGFLAGWKGGLGWWVGGLAMTLAFGPMLCIGAYERAKDAGL